MSLITQFKIYISNKNIDMPFLFVMIGLVLMPLFHYSWIISMVACIFMKEDEI